MAYRGRLIWPLEVSISPVDTQATAAVDPVGPAVSGYDDLLEEPVLVAPAESGELPPEGATRPGEATVFGAQQTLSAQIEVEDFNELRQFMSGNQPGFTLELIFHMIELESRGLVDADGFVSLRVNSRLDRIRSVDGTTNINLVPYDIRATKAEQRGFGMSGLTGNLFLLAFSDREKGASLGVV